MSPLQFLKEVREELGRVTWPTKDEVIEATIGVILFCAVISVYFWILDSIFAQALRLIIAR